MVDGQQDVRKLFVSLTLDIAAAVLLDHWHRFLIMAVDVEVILEKLLDLVEVFLGDVGQAASGA